MLMVIFNKVGVHSKRKTLINDRSRKGERVGGKNSEDKISYYS